MHKRLGDVLIDRKVVTPDQILLAIEQQSITGRPLGEVLVQMKLATEEQLAEALAEQQDVPTWNLTKKPPTPEAISLLPGDFCLRNNVLPVKVTGQVLMLAMQNAGNLAVVDEARKLTRMWVQAVQAPDQQIADAIRDAYHQGKEDSADEFISQALDEFSVPNIEEVSNVTREEDTRPVIGLVNQIISDALKLRASDIHLEPREKTFDLRYRIDGSLVKKREIPIALMPMVVARVKIMADLDVADHRLPQDGRIAVKIGNRAVDLRVSIFPCKHGSRIVFRVLDRGAALKRLDELGFNERNVLIFRDLIEKPYGIVLVTGPTGSGKTTTLYAALNEIRSERTNILTCEDPVEYEIPGISQSQVHEKIGLTFAAQLRSILRQDPDVVLVGEMRDQETAEIAIRAALTGHLVLSTLHCNDAPSAIPRLIDMGVAPYLVASSLIGIVAQRLLRVLCPECKKLAPPTDRDLAIMRAFDRHMDQVWTPVGCPQCNGSGYAGRMAVHEILPITEDMGRAIASDGSVEVLREKGLAHGYRPMQLDAFDRVEKGLTTFEEARRLIFFTSSLEPDECEVALDKAS
ncbi:MAG TPA: ATPase, T2SS/T4P/T4SS family [Fimbriimonas sp.]|nr:ATPase, T2SS/T4P/T4SS family [Fimbriimonas sp.]